MQTKNKKERSSAEPNVIKRTNCSIDLRLSSCSVSLEYVRVLRRTLSKRTRHCRRSTNAKFSLTWTTTMNIWLSYRMNSLKSFNVNINLKFQKRKSRSRKRRLREAIRLLNLKRKKMSFVIIWSSLLTSPNELTMKIESLSRKTLSFVRNLKHKRITVSLALSS